MIIPTLFILSTMMVVVSFFCAVITMCISINIANKKFKYQDHELLTKSVNLFFISLVFLGFFIPNTMVLNEAAWLDKVKEEVRECEKDIPRTQECVMMFVPKQIEEN